MDIEGLQKLVDDVKAAREVLGRRDQVETEAQAAERRRDKALADLAKAETSLADIQARAGAEAERFNHEKRRHDLVLQAAQDDNQKRTNELDEKYRLARVAFDKEHAIYLSGLRTEKSDHEKAIEALRAEHGTLQTTVRDLKQRLTSVLG